MATENEKQQQNEQGRPKIPFNPAWCQMLITHMAEGFSFESFAGRIGISKQTLYNFAKTEPSFLDAKEIGTEKCRLWFESIGKNGMMGIRTISVKAIDPETKKETTKVERLGQFLGGLWTHQMRCRFPDEWRDVQIHQHQGGISIEDLRDRADDARKREKEAATMESTFIAGVVKKDSNETE